MVEWGPARNRFNSYPALLRRASAALKRKRVFHSVAQASLQVDPWARTLASDRELHFREMASIESECTADVTSDQSALSSPLGG